MDQIKIGKFIAQRRKAQGLTQMQLAEKMNVTDRAVSKWETGRSLPDSSIMLDLCGVLGISVNDLLTGEVVTMKDYNETAEQVMLDMVKQKEESDKKMLTLEIVIGVLSMIVLLGFTFIASFVEMQTWLRITLIVSGFVVGMAGCAFALVIEQTAGYYKCSKCGHCYVPTYGSVLWAMHYGRTRHMKCPNCNRHTWCKKVLKR